MENPNSQPVNQDDAFEGDDLHGDVKILARGTGVTAAGSILGRFIHMVTDIWLARLLGPGGFGLYSIAWNLHRLLGIFISLGIPTGTLAFGVKYWKKDNARFRAVFEVGTITVLFSGIVTALVAWLTADWFAVVVFKKPETAQAIRTAGLVMPFMMLLYTSSSLTRVTKRMQFSIIAGELVASLSMLLVFAFLYWITGQFWAVLVSIIVSYAFAAATALFFTHQLFPELRQPVSREWRPAFRELLGFSLPTMLAGAVGTSNLWINRLLAGVFFPADQVGLYQAASQFNNLFAILLGSVVAVFMPMIASLHHAGEKDRLNELYKITTKWSLYINLPVVIVALLLPRDVMRFFYGDDFTQGAGLLMILTVGQLVNVGTGATGGLFMMTGRQNDLFKLTVFGFVAGISSAVLLIPYLGIASMAVGVLVSSLCINVLGTLWLARRDNLWPYDFRYFKGLLASFLTALTIWLTPQFAIGVSSMLILRAGLGLVVFIGVLWLTGLDREDTAFLAEFRHIIFNRIFSAGKGKSQ